ncbi:hypothetical protein LK533_15280 [Sphingomonas sp. PL-96]|uniref:hypothetical protein n=1 Tax=Sphingomonas sp. PL-96 TaxID=2887201 RepID=UPI001E44071E|nr:hypothetical protein [Sphingomonas sp. PL-96]MCC2978026.1 hypothetical protein [Sphingomonas sp. PL-96]
MIKSERDYFYSRAEVELRMAQTARDPNAVRAHYTLAGHYLDRAFAGSVDEPPSVAQIRAQIPVGPASR